MNENYKKPIKITIEKEEIESKSFFEYQKYIIFIYHIVIEEDKKKKGKGKKNLSFFLNKILNLIA